ncbi:MAG: phosphotransferase, partial [Lachnospiraceae bacterium]|nr:phosphotransferase [Lachnospiraceae bacterium]
ISETKLRKMKEKFLGTMRDFEDLPSVLCHGDLSKKNIIMQDHGEILLIDWDDATAFNWMADISRLTFWMKLNYNEQDCVLFRNTFLKHYRTAYRKSEFISFESAFHIYSALDSLLFFISIGDKEMEKRLIGDLDGLDLQ